MLTRIISALVGIPIVVALLFYHDGRPFTVLVAVAALLGLLEFYRGAAKGKVRPFMLFGVAMGALFFYFGGWFGLDVLRMIDLIPTFTALILLAFVIELFQKDRKPFLNVGTTVLGVGYVVWMLLHLIWLRDSGSVIKVGPWQSELGAWLVMFVFLTTWAVDTGAYFAGRAFGKRKLAPSLSPGKTIEGSIGGFVLAIIVGAVVGQLIKLPQPHGLILGALVGIAAQFGDLTESALKREVGIKDFGALIPGHGGMLDRIDSLLFTGPLVFWYLTILLPKFAGG